MKIYKIYVIIDFSPLWRPILHIYENLQHMFENLQHMFENLQHIYEMVNLRW